MYLKHFGLNEYPFSLTPDTSYFFPYGHYHAALNTLLVALRQSEGFIKVTGEVGSGKTLICRKLLSTLDNNDHITAYILNPFFGPAALVLALADELQLEMPRNMGLHRTLKAITQRLVEYASANKKVVLCIDEAQVMPNDTLEALRLLTNIETEKRKLLHVILFGQPELDERLKERGRRQLLQRITFAYKLQPIDQRGLIAYVEHRLTIAGSSGRLRFEREALDLLYRASGGYPRLINVLAHKSLMLCFGQGEYVVREIHLRAAIADTEGASLSRGWLGSLWTRAKSLRIALVPSLLLLSQLTVPTAPGGLPL